MIAPWWPERALCLDTESTGVNVDTDRVVTAYAAIVEDGVPVYERRWLIAVDIDIPAEAQAVHGVSTAHAQENGIPAAQGVKEIAGAVRFALTKGFPIIAFNVAFDASILNAECTRVGLGSLTEFCGGDIWPVIDPFCIDKGVDRFRAGSRKLTNVAAHYGVPLGDDAHDAGADAIAAARVAYRLAARSVLPEAQLRGMYSHRKYPDKLVAAWLGLGRMSLADLHIAQVEWFAEQAKGLSAHWMKEANQYRAVADRDETSDEDRAIALQEAAELDAKVASITCEWPIRTTPAVAPVAVAA